MKNRFLIVMTLAAFAISGCTVFNGTRFEDVFGAERNLISLSYRIAKKLEESAYPPLMPRRPDQPVLVTTFVDNNDLTRTSHFGRVLQEHITSRFVQLGYTVKELKLRDNLLIQPKSGETMLSRDLSLISPSPSAQAILVGTYSITDRVMYISARLINPETSVIISSADYRLFMDKNVLAMFGMKKEGDDPYAIAPPHEPLLNKVLYY